MQAKWLSFPCSCNATFITRGPGRERAWFVRKHQEERRKPGILLKCWHNSRKRRVCVTVLPCIFDDLRWIQPYILFFFGFWSVLILTSQGMEIWEQMMAVQNWGGHVWKEEEMNSTFLRSGPKWVWKIIKIWNASRQFCRDIDCLL